MGIRFEWDRDKAEANFKKHGVGFSEAITVFNDPFSRTVEDEDHSHQEDRLWTIGLSERGRLIVVTHADDGDITRIINARLPDSRERRDYEEGE